MIRTAQQINHYEIIDRSSPDEVRMQKLEAGKKRNKYSFTQGCDLRAAYHDWNINRLWLVRNCGPVRKREVA